MIRQNLSSFQLPPNFTESIMRKLSRITPTAPAANKTRRAVGAVCGFGCVDFPIDGGWHAIPLPFPKTLRPKRYIGTNG